MGSSEGDTPAMGGFMSGLMASLPDVPAASELLSFDDAAKAMMLAIEIETGDVGRLTPAAAMRRLLEALLGIGPFEGQAPERLAVYRWWSDRGWTLLSEHSPVIEPEPWEVERGIGPQRFRSERTNALLELFSMTEVGQAQRFALIRAEAWPAFGFDAVRERLRARASAADAGPRPAQNTKVAPQLVSAREKGEPWDRAHRAELLRQVNEQAAYLGPRMKVAALLMVADAWDISESNAKTQLATARNEAKSR